jgi:AhpD family alkylhydroperoxidase
MTDIADTTPITRGENLIQEAKFNWGFVPDQTQKLAQAVDALDSYSGLLEKFTISSLTPIEQEVVYITTSRENRCGYCVAAHSQCAVSAGMLAEQLAALRAGRPTGIARLDTLQALTRAVVAGKGRVSKDVGDAFVEAGFRQEQVFEILTGIAAKMLSNFFNEIVGMPLEDDLVPYAWEPSVGGAVSGSAAS